MEQSVMEESHAPLMDVEDIFNTRIHNEANIESAVFYAHSVTHIINHLTTHYLPPPPTASLPLPAPPQGEAVTRLHQMLSDLFLCPVRVSPPHDIDHFKYLRALLEPFHAARIAQFEHVCRQFYFESDDGARLVLEQYEHSKRNKGKLFEVQTLTPASFLHVLTPLLPQGLHSFSPSLTQTLPLIGFFRNPAHTSTSVEWCLMNGSAFLSKMEEAKSRIRAERHHVLAQEQNRNLLQCLAPHLQTQSPVPETPSFEVIVEEDPSPSPSPSPSPAPSVTPFSQTLERVRLFVETHSPSPTTHPFLKGLRLLFIRQLEQYYRAPDPASSVQLCLVWDMDAAVLTQSGASETFMYDSVALMATDLRCSIEVLMDEAKEGVISRLRWTVNPDLSNAEIHSLIKLLPRPSVLGGRATGKIETSETPRRNAGPVPSSSMMSWLAFFIQRIVFRLFLTEQ